MGKFDDRGICPYDSFEEYMKRYPSRNKEIKKKTLAILGVRIYYMIYLHDEYPEKPYVANMFFGGNGILGLEVAAALREHIWECIYRKKGKLIRIHNIDSCDQMPPDTRIYKDSRYIVGLYINDNNYYADIKIVDMYICKR